MQQDQRYQSQNNPYSNIVEEAYEDEDSYECRLWLVPENYSISIWFIIMNVSISKSIIFISKSALHWLTYWLSSEKMLTETKFIYYWYIEN